MTKLKAIIDPLPLYSRPNSPSIFRHDKAANCQNMDWFATTRDGQWFLVFTHPQTSLHLWAKKEHVQEVGLEPPPPSTRTLFGLHMRADGRNAPSDYALVDRAKIEAVKLMSTASEEDVRAVRTIAPNAFILVRMFADFSSRRVSPDDFSSWMKDDLSPFYTVGVRWFEVHNEPNLREEGMWRSWQNGRDFADWFMRVREMMRYHFPEIKLVFPGLSPANIITSPNRYDDLRFLNEAQVAVRVADAVGCHCYWRNETEMRSRHGGLYWQEYRRFILSRPLYVTEYSNPLPEVSGREKGRQYLEYHRLINTLPQPPLATFAFVSSASSQFQHEAWRDETGNFTDIAIAVVEGRGRHR